MEILPVSSGGEAASVTTARSRQRAARHWIAIGRTAARVERWVVGRNDQQTFVHVRRRVLAHAPAAAFMTLRIAVLKLERNITGVRGGIDGGPSRRGWRHGRSLLYPQVEMRKHADSHVAIGSNNLAGVHV